MNYELWIFVSLYDFPINQSTNRSIDLNRSTIVIAHPKKNVPYAIYLCYVTYVYIELLYIYINYIYTHYVMRNQIKNDWIWIWIWIWMIEWCLGYERQRRLSLYICRAWWQRTGAGTRRDPGRRSHQEGHQGADPTGGGHRGWYGVHDTRRHEEQQAQEIQIFK